MLTVNDGVLAHDTLSDFLRSCFQRIRKSLKLERDWTKNRLEQFTWDARNFGRDGQGHLFEPSVRETIAGLGKKKLGRLVRSCRALVDRARKSGIGTAFDCDRNCIMICGDEPDDQIAEVTLKYFESYQVDMQWGIFGWAPKPVQSNSSDR